MLVRDSVGQGHDGSHVTPDHDRKPSSTSTTFATHSLTWHQDSAGEECYAGASDPNECRAQSSDYLECLHHPKGIERSEAIQAELVRKVEREVKEGRKASEIFSGGAVSSVGLIKKEGDSK
ncbi:hypothetical protein BJ165DRAFT_1524397 [Panaeolus papilionaceus]|nr:hypothetical protein BJ165DRAFT_1524397 [Panaeolus papilionaceus]